MNGLVFLRNKEVITGPFPAHRVRKMLADGTLEDGTEISADKRHWEPIVPPVAPPKKKSPPPEDTPPVCGPCPIEGAMRLNVVPVCLDEALPQNLSSSTSTTKKKESNDPVGHSHLWPFCHLICAMTAWRHHANALERRCNEVTWTAILYGVLAFFAPMAYFGRAYPAWHGYLWGAIFASVAMTIAVVFVFLVVAIANRLRAEQAPRRVCLIAAMTLLTMFSTLFGTATVLLQGVCHPRPWGKLMALLALMLVTALFATGSRQLILGFAAPSEASIRRRSALRVWGLWMTLSMLEISFFSLFSLGLI